MMPNKWLEERESRFANFCKKFPHIMLSPLVVACEISPDSFNRYKTAVEAYNNASHDHEFVNLTPAGMLMPKREIESLFSDVVASFLDICASLNILDSMKGWNIPAIRHKTAAPKPEHLKRQYVSEDAHSDSWIGWSPDTLLFVIPVLGDTQRNWVRFFRHPSSADASWTQKLGSFRDEKALDMISQCEPLARHYEPGYLYIADMSVIHQTIRDADASWRVGMEMVGHLEEPRPDTTAAATKFSPAEAEALRLGRKRFQCDLKMGEIADYAAATRPVDIHLVDV